MRALVLASGLGLLSITAALPVQPAQNASQPLTTTTMSSQVSSMVTDAAQSTDAADHEHGVHRIPLIPMHYGRRYGKGRKYHVVFNHTSTSSLQPSVSSDSVVVATTTSVAATSTDLDYYFRTVTSLATVTTPPPTILHPHHHHGHRDGHGHTNATSSHLPNYRVLCAPWRNGNDCLRWTSEFHIIKTKDGKNLIQITHVEPRPNVVCMYFPFLCYYRKPLPKPEDRVMTVEEAQLEGLLLHYKRHHAHRHGHENKTSEPVMVDGFKFESLDEAHDPIISTVVSVLAEGKVKPFNQALPATEGGHGPVALNGTMGQPHFVDIDNEVVHVHHKRELGTTAHHHGHFKHTHHRQGVNHINGSMHHGPHHQGMTSRKAMQQHVVLPHVDDDQIHVLVKLPDGMLGKRAVDDNNVPTAAATAIDEDEQIHVQVLIPDAGMLGKRSSDTDTNTNTELKARADDANVNANANANSNTIIAAIATTDAKQDKAADSDSVVDYVRTSQWGGSVGPIILDKNAHGAGGAAGVAGVAPRAVVVEGEKRVLEVDVGGGGGDEQ